MKKFELSKQAFDRKYGNSSTIDCFLPVHLTKNKVENKLYKKDGTHNEQYYKWQFLYSFVNEGFCSKDFIGVEVNFPKGNKNSANIKIDAAIFDNKDWFEHYTNFHTVKDDSKWDELHWLKEHLLCTMEFKKEDSKDVKGVFNSQLKAYMSESTKNIVFGILYDEGRLYLFRSEGKEYIRLSDEFNITSKKVEPTFDVPDAYSNLLSFDEMMSFDPKLKSLKDYSHRRLNDLEIISKTDATKMNTALYAVTETMDKLSLMNQRGYNILIQFMALKIFDEKKNSDNLLFYVNEDEAKFSRISEDGIQSFLKRIELLSKSAKVSYNKILNENNFDIKDENQIRVAVSIVQNFQHFSFTRSERSNLYQLVFYQFASQFSKNDNAQYVTPLQVIDFIVDIVNPKHNELIIDPTVGIADFLSVSYVKSNGSLDDNNFYGMDVSSDMVKLATLNMLLNGDGNANIEVASGLGSIITKFAEDGTTVELVPKTEKNKNNYNGDWDNRKDKDLKKFDVVLTNPPFGDARAWTPKNDRELEIAQCYELWNIYKQKKIDLGVIFLENAVRLLKENGRMAIVLSNSIAAIDKHKKARQWLMDNLRIVAIIDLNTDSSVFAEAGVKPSIIIGYKPSKKELDKLKTNDYEVFSKEIKKIGYEIKTKNTVKCFEPQYKLNFSTFEKEINSDGSAKLDEEFSDTVQEFRKWCLSQEDQLKKLFL